MLHPRDTLHHCAVFLEGGYIEAHRFLIEFTLVFDKPPSIQQRLKRRSKWFVAVVGFMILAFTTKEELCTRLWMHRRLLVYDPQRLSRNVIYCSTPHPFDSSPHLVAIGFGAGKNNTSSDASREVPERTYNDTPKEAKLHGPAVSSSLRRYVELDSQVFLVTPPDAADGGCALSQPYRTRGKSITPPRSKH